MAFPDSLRPELDSEMFTTLQGEACVFSPRGATEIIELSNELEGSISFSVFNAWFIHTSLNHVFASLNHVFVIPCLWS